MASIFYKWLILLWLPFFPSQQDAHPIYVSVTEIEHNAAEKTLEISCRIFTDDFEKTLRNEGAATVDLLQPKDKSAMNQLVSQYIRRHLKISVNDQPVTLQFLGYEQAEEAIQSYFQVNNMAVVKKLDVQNNLLYEFKSEQMSLMHITVNGSRKSTRLNNPDDKAGFTF